MDVTWIFAVLPEKREKTLAVRIRLQKITGPRLLAPDGRPHPNFKARNSPSPLRPKRASLREVSVSFSKQRSDTAAIQTPFLKTIFFKSIERPRLNFCGLTRITWEGAQAPWPTYNMAQASDVQVPHSRIEFVVELLLSLVLPFFTLNLT